MCQKSGQIVRQFYAVMLTSSRLQSPKVLQVFKEPPKDHIVSRLVANHVVGKSEPSGHPYGDKPQVHIVPVHIPLDILYG
jgi:hypothetical protein